jgi:hypothetical protein
MEMIPVISQCQPVQDVGLGDGIGFGVEGFGSIDSLISSSGSSFKLHPAINKERKSIIKTRIEKYFCVIS